LLRVIFTARWIFQIAAVNGVGVLSYRVLPRFSVTALIVLLVNSAICCFLWFTPTFQFSIANNEIRPELGGAYQTADGFVERYVYFLPTDSVGSPASSNLMMFEDGRALRPSHSLHTDIREKGRGRYSHWDGSIIFSSTDGTDPRSNGRAYSVRSSTEVKPQFKLPLVSILALLDVAFLLIFRREIILFLRVRYAVLLAGLGVTFVVAVALSAFDMFGTIVVAKEGLPKDAALAFHTLQHAALGCLTSIGIWAAGAGISRSMLRDPHAGLAQILIPAFPVSLALLAVLLSTALVIPWGRPIAFALWLACLIPLARWRPPREQIAALLKAAIGIVPFAAAFGIWLALLWHGPTATLPASPTGDLSHYAGITWSLARQAYPYLDLGYANAGTLGYFNSLYPALGAALLYFPNFDPFLFLLASGGTSYVLLSALMLHLYLAERASRPMDLSDLLILVLSIVVAARYPYWVAESIPMVFVPGLTISVWWMAERGRHAFGWSLAAMLAGLSGSALSKIVSAAVLVPLGAAGIWSRIRSLPYPARLSVLGVGGIFSVYSAAILVHFLPGFLAYSVVGPESFRTPQWYFVCRDAGALLMMALAWIIADLPVALALSLGLTTFLVYSWVFQVNFVCVSIVLGLILVSGAALSVLVRTLALTAFALSLPALILGDQASASSGVIWIVCLGGAVLAATLSAVGITTVAPQLTLRASTSVAITALMITGLGLVGVARGSIIVDSGWHFFQREKLTPELKEIWSVVRERTPKDTLVFTDQVDETEHLLGGWNSYAYSGQRQVYLSSYVSSLSLRNDKEKLREILSINRSVLDGSELPAKVPTQRRYNSFHAVVSTSHAVPKKWKLIFKNRQYALYDIM
jgi:hypothetical protein